MRFLANENFPLASVRRLREAQHDVVSVAETSPGIKDEEILSLAARESRALLTFDRDYGELIYLRGMPPPQGVIYLRFVPLTPTDPAEIVLGLERVEGLRIENRYTVVDPPRIRQRPLPEPFDPHRPGGPL
jgi:predicted nuclease of predicted toxin-antitoxin system